MNQEALSVTVGDGKYTVQQDASGRLTALRYGEPWRDCCGDGLIYTLAAEVESLREQLARETHGKELQSQVAALVDMVFNGQSAPWVNKSGGRFIDTKEWCDFHVRWCEIQREAELQMLDSSSQ